MDNQSLNNKQTIIIMKCKDIELNIKEGNPFAEDKLDRAHIAYNLTGICELLSESGAVLAIDGEWGAGKTTFVKMWKQMLVDKNYTTIYFNAWNSDFQSDPFVALMSELNDVFKASDGFKTVVESGSKIAIRVLGELTKGFIKYTTGIDSDAIKSGINEVTDLCYNQMAEYQNKKSGLLEFRTKLSEFVASENKGKPVFFFIDELDRCNPHFAVKLLERIKHLFEVPNIIFVLAVNIDQLQYAVQGYYGSALLDGKQYLKRFIDIEYNLPAPNLEKYCKFMIENYDFSSFFNHTRRRNNYEFHSDMDYFETFATDIIVASNLNLRITNKIFVYTRLALSGFSLNQYVYADLFFLLCYFKLTDNELYNCIKEGKLTIQELLNTIEDHLPQALFKSGKRYLSEHHIAYALAGLLFKYNFSGSRGIPREESFKGVLDTDSNKYIFPISSKYISQNKLSEALVYKEKHSREYTSGLNSLFDKIDLIDDLNF